MIPTVVKGNDFLLRIHVNTKDNEEDGWIAYDLTRAVDVRAYLVRDDRLSERIPLTIDEIVGDYVGVHVNGSKVRPGMHGVEVMFQKPNGNNGRVFRKGLLEILNCNEESGTQENDIEADVGIYVNLDVETIDIGKDTVDQALRDQVAQNTADILTKAPRDSVEEDLSNLEVLELLGLD